METMTIPNTEIRLCPHCQKEVSKKATRCPYCQSDLREGRGVRILLITVVTIIIIIVVLSVVGAAETQTSTSSNTTSTTDPLELNATVEYGGDGVTITNDESSAWTNCMFGINGGTGWGFDNPPYQTRSPLTILSGQQILVPYAQITLKDGTEFDPTTHAINTAVLECFQGTANLRDWIGST